MEYSEIYGAITTRVNDASTACVNVAKADVNNAQRDVCTRYPFSWLMKDGTISTDVQDHFVISDDISDLWKIHSIREEDTPKVITAITMDTWRKLKADNPDKTGIPDFYTDEYEDRIYWYPQPDAAYDMYVKYWKTAVELDEDTDVSIIPARYHEVLILGGLYRTLQYKKQYAEATAIKVEYEAFIAKIIDDDADNVDLIEYQEKSLIGRPILDGPRLSQHYRRY